jgi:endonuclease/exonuclease/phosphatase family metal-dependent hydrolase
VSFSVLTYNIWHGLTTGPRKTVVALEKRLRRERRFELLKKELLAEPADVLCLQELNPVWSKSLALAKHLNMHELHQIDNSGVKVLGMGYPPQLNTGLAILAKKTLRLSKKRKTRLSHKRVGFATDFFSFQWRDLRYALAVEIDKPEVGKILVVNTHLHHAPRITEELNAEIHSHRKRGQLTSAQEMELRESLFRGADARREEVKKLMRWLEKYQTKYSNIILCGDMNFTVDDEEMQIVKDSGYEDVVQGKLNSWDPAKNKENFEITKKIEFPVPCFGSQIIREMIIANDAMARRIDHVFVFGEIAKKYKDAKLVGLSNEFGFCASDHFGIKVEFDI